MAFVTETYQPKLSLRDRAADWIKTYRENARKRRVYLHTVSELERMSIRDMYDIGIHPSMIKEIAYEAAYGTN